jgi:hypothetical protein
MKGVRDILAKHQPLVIVLVLILLGITWWSILSGDGVPENGGQAYFYDMGTGKLYVDSALKNPPTEAPSGAEGVIAHVFTCADPADETKRFIGFLEKYTPEYQKMRDKGQAMPPSMAAKHQLIRAADGGDWVSLDSQGGQKILAGLAARRKPGENMVSCVP